MKWFINIKELFSKNKINKKSNNRYCNIDSNNPKTTIKNSQVIHNVLPSDVLDLLNKIESWYDKKDQYIDEYFSCKNCLQEYIHATNYALQYIDSCEKAQLQEFEKTNSPVLIDYSRAINDGRNTIRLIQENKMIHCCKEHRNLQAKFVNLLEKIDRCYSLYEYVITNKK